MYFPTDDSRLHWPLAPALLLVLLLLGPEARSAPPLDWTAGPGYRTALVTPETRGTTGFARMLPPETGVTFSNRLSDATVAQNRLLELGSGVALARKFHTLSTAAGCKPDWRRWPRVPHRTVCPHTARFGIASAALPSGLSLRLATKRCEISGLGDVNGDGWADRAPSPSP